MWRPFVRGLALLTALNASACGKGGMDGAGAAITPTCWADIPDVKIQPLWSGGQLRYLIVNERPSAIELRTTCARPATVQALCTWSVPAQSTRVFELPVGDGTVQSEASSGSHFFSLADDIGEAFVVWRPPQTIPTEDFVSNSADVTGACANPQAQIETDFVARPSRAFSLTINVISGTTLTLSKRGAKVGNLQLVDTLAVRSQQAEVQSDDARFVVTIPANASREAPARIEVDVEVPASAEQDLAVAFTAKLEGSFLGGTTISRVFPRSE